MCAMLPLRLFRVLFVLSMLGAWSCTARRVSGAQCMLNSECADRLVCVIGSCRLQCAMDRDCERTEFCLPGDRPSLNVCLPIGVDRPCAMDVDCGPNAACRSDSRCHSRCTQDSSCSSGRCTTASGFCDDPDHVTMGATDAGVDAAMDVIAPRDVPGVDVLDAVIPPVETGTDVVDVPGPDIIDAGPPMPTRGFVLLYNSTTGAAVFGGIAMDGLFFTIQTLAPADLGSAWTHVVAATRMSTGPALQALLYNRMTNSHVIRYFTPTGLVAATPTGAALPGAPSPTHLALSSGGHVLWTNQSLGTPTWEARLVFPVGTAVSMMLGSSGWTASDMSGFLLAATHNGSFFAYSTFSSANNAVHGGYTSAGSQIMGMRAATYPMGFTHVAATTVDDLLLYNSNTNALAVMYAPASGTGAGIMGNDTYPRPSGSSPASQVTSTDGGTVVFYRSFTGDVDTGTSTRAAPFTRLRTTLGYPGYTHAVGF